MTNFFGTLLVDAAGVGLAAFGLLNPVLAAIVHVSSEMLFILNSARLLAASTSRAQPLRASRLATGAAGPALEQA